MDNETMGKRICQMRKSHNMTMEELGQKLGVGRSAVNKWEKGYVKNIPRATIERMAQVLECSASWLMGFDELASYDNGAQFEHDWLIKGGARHPITLTFDEEALIRQLRAQSTDTSKMCQHLQQYSKLMVRAIPKLEGDPVAPIASADEIPYVHETEEYLKNHYGAKSMTISEQRKDNVG